MGLRDDVAIQSENIIKSAITEALALQTTVRGHDLSDEQLRVILKDYVKPTTPDGETPRTSQLAFDAYYEIAALPILHTDAVCNILADKFGTLERELHQLEKEKRELVEALESIEEYWNGSESSAIDAAEEMRYRAKIARTNWQNLTK
jgi:hypothetical protein